MASTFTRKEIEVAFELFDDNGDGTISARELSNALLNLGVDNFSAEKLLKHFYKNVNATLNIDEFTKVVHVATTPDEQELKEAFDEFDKDGSGCITKEELKQAMKEMGEKLSDKEIEEMIAAADKNRKVGFEGKGEKYNFCETSLKFSVL